MPRSRKRRRPWTAGEVRQLRLWRSQRNPLSLAECARRLNRTRGAVVAQLGRQGFVTQPHYSCEQIRELIQQHVERGHCDRTIARLIGRSVYTVRMRRWGMGLPANRKVKQKPKRKTTRKVPHAECFACGDVCPRATHIGKVGWVSRKFGTQGLLETYCPACFAKWGWPPELFPITHSAFVEFGRGAP